MDTTVKRGEIYYADLSPVVGSEQGGIRPVLIVQYLDGTRGLKLVPATNEPAGTGYAVANAHPTTRAVATHVLPSNNDDGVGHLLEAVLAAHSGHEARAAT